MKRRFDEYRKERQWRDTYRRYSDFTMISELSFARNLELASGIKSLEGCVVECGVWRGGMSAGIASVMGPNRTYYLFDSFEGLPPAKDIDGQAALQWQKNTDSPTYHNNCSAAPEFARKAMTMTGVKRFELIQGWFQDTVTRHKVVEPIALLRLDADWYESTMVCLDAFFDQVVPGGLIILDDYYAWDGCSRALHDFLSRRSATERIHNLSGVCFLVRQSAAAK